MKSPSELERFLNEEPEEAITPPDNSVESGLPFRTAWVLKLVQCAVREGALASFQVELNAREAVFVFFSSSFSLDEVEAAFADSESTQSMALRYLIGALRAIGLHEQWPFEMKLPKLTDCLIWDGQEFHRRPVEKKVVKTTLIVRFEPAKEEGWLNGVMSRADMNAEVLNTIKRFCFTCPVPLIVDGRRMDSLQACPRHGWSATSFPLAMGFAEAPIPKVTLSPGTFEQKATRKSSSDRSGGKLKYFGEQVLSRVSHKQSSSVPFLLTFHAEAKKERMRTVWSERAEESLLYWVLDGVVIETEQLSPNPTSCSVGVFVSAEGLVDPVAFQLLETPERIERRAQVLSALIPELRSLDVLDETMKELSQAAREKGTWTRGFYLVATFGTLWLSPAVAALFGAAFSFSSLFSSHASIKKTMESYRGEIAELVGVLERQVSLD